MAPAFSKEAILQGIVDHFCLVCDSYLRTHLDIATHVAQVAHRNNLSRTNYLEKYRSDRIREVKKLYFCEFCNILLSTITKVRLHVEEPGHNENKTVEEITRERDTIILAEGVVIHEDVWHGLMDDSCTVCNVEFQKQDDHKKKSTHIINLIQSKVNKVNKNVYRKIDDSTFHCLTCNKVVANINIHFDHIEHKEVLLKCVKATSSKQVPVQKQAGKLKNKKPNINIGPNVANNHNEENMDSLDDCNTKFDEHVCAALGAKNYIVKMDGATWCILCDSFIESRHETRHLNCEHHQKLLKMHQERGKTLKACANVTQETNAHVSDILDLIQKFQDDNITINLEMRTAVCRKCSMSLEYNTKDIENHLEEHKKNSKKKSEENPETILLKKDDFKQTDSTTLSTSPVLRSREVENEKAVEKEAKEQTKQERDEGIQKSAEANGLTYNSSGKEIYCQNCNKLIPPSIKNIKEHVNGTLHKNNTNMSNGTVNLKENGIRKKKDEKVTPKKCELTKVNTEKFVATYAYVEQMFLKDMVLNKKYCINLWSLALVHQITQTSVRCYLCEVDLQLNHRNVIGHITDKKHDKIVHEIPVVIHVDSEFIREIRSGLFHCGYCNIVECSWKRMEDHLALPTHEECKAFADWRLVQNIPLIEQYKLEEAYHCDIFQRFLRP